MARTNPSILALRYNRFFELEGEAARLEAELEARLSAVVGLIMEEFHQLATK